MRSSKSKIINNQDGLVSFIVSAVIMSILSLITVGFARAMQKEQRSATDKQLSTQAFYAAESGINDVTKAVASGTITSQISDCSQNATFDSSQIVGYTCVLYTPKVDKIVITAPTDNSHLTMLRSAGSPLTAANISWQSTDSSWNAPNSNVNFPAKTSWNSSQYVSALRLSVYPVPRATGFARLGGAGLNALARTYFLYPQAGASGSINLGATTDGSIVYSNCNAGSTYKCNVSLTGLDGATYDYYLRIRSIYNDSSLLISGSSATGAEQLEGAQAIVDSTGKANDLKRRIQVRKSLIPQYYWPEYAVETTSDICKLLYVGSNFSADNSGCGDAVDANGIN